MQTLQQSGESVDRTLSVERALRRVLASLLAEGVQARTQTDIDTVEGPVLVIRSGPWPLLRALLARLATNERARPITVLCHRRDESALAALSASGGGLGLEVLPLFYPRFETFNTSTLRRLVAGGAWRTTFVVDASRTGRGESLEHVTTAVSSGDAFVWNAGGMTWRQKTLRERLSRESYALVRDPCAGTHALNASPGLRFRKTPQGRVA